MSVGSSPRPSLRHRRGDAPTVPSAPGPQRTLNTCRSVTWVRILDNNSAGTRSRNRLHPGAKVAEAEELNILLRAPPGLWDEPDPAREAPTDPPGRTRGWLAAENPRDAERPGPASGAAAGLSARGPSALHLGRGRRPAESGPNGRRARSPRASPAAPPASASAEPPAPPPPWCDRPGRPANHPAPAHSALPPSAAVRTRPTHCAAPATPRHHQSSPELRRLT